jgi:2-keto-4-pentenoate hydratase
VHATWTGYRFNLEQNTADNSSAGQVVIGPRLPVTDLMVLDAVAVRLHDGSGHTLGQGVGADADGHPLDALARELAAFDLRLEAGDLVISGGVTAACVLKASGQLVGVFSREGDAWSVAVTVRRG